jgi:hypothetical protein
VALLLQVVCQVCVKAVGLGSPLVLATLQFGQKYGTNRSESGCEFANRIR